MVSENVYSSDGQFLTFKCILCGEYVDPIILENRQNHEAKTRRGQRPRKENTEGSLEQFYPPDTPGEALQDSPGNNP